MDRDVWTDQRVEILLGNLLRFGVLLAGGVVFLSGIWYLVRFGAAPVNYGVFHGEPSDLRSIPGILKDVAACECRGVMQLGVLLLIATPVARVAFSVFAFLRQRDHTYVVITLIVLGVLLLSLGGALPSG